MTTTTDDHDHDHDNEAAEQAVINGALAVGAALGASLMGGFLLIVRTWVACPGFPCRTFPLLGGPEALSFMASGWVTLGFGVTYLLTGVLVSADLWRNRHDLGMHLTAGETGGSP